MLRGSGGGNLMLISSGDEGLMFISGSGGSLLCMSGGGGSLMLMSGGGEGLVLLGGVGCRVCTGRCVTSGVLMLISGTGLGRPVVGEWALGFLYGVGCWVLWVSCGKLMLMSGVGSDWGMRGTGVGRGTRLGVASCGRVMLMRWVGSLWGVGVGRRVRLHGGGGGGGGRSGCLFMLVVFCLWLWVVHGGQAGYGFTVNLTLLRKSWCSWLFLFLAWGWLTLGMLVLAVVLVLFPLFWVLAVVGFVGVSLFVELFAVGALVLPPLFVGEGVARLRSSRVLSFLFHLLVRLVATRLAWARRLPIFPLSYPVWSVRHYLGWGLGYRSVLSRHALIVTQPVPLFL